MTAETTHRRAGGLEGEGWPLTRPHWKGIYGPPLNFMVYSVAALEAITSEAVARTCGDTQGWEWLSPAYYFPVEIKVTIVPPPPTTIPPAAGGGEWEQ